MEEQWTITEDTLRAILDAFNRHDTEAVLGYFAEDCSMDLPRGTAPWGRRFVGKAQVREGIAGRFAGVPDVLYSDDRHVVCGDRGVSEWRLMGTTVAGARVDVRGCDLWEFARGLVIRKDSYWKIVE